MPDSQTSGEALAKLFNSPGNAHPQMEFIDLLAEVTDSSESAQAARREGCKSLGEMEVLHHFGAQLILILTALP